MYVCFALIVDYEIQNIARKIVYDLSEKYKIKAISSRLPQHISLKQSFFVNDISDIESYFDNFSSKIEPFEVVIEKIELRVVENNTSSTQILWFKIKEDSILRMLHTRLNKELMDKFNIKKQGFDGDMWRFHSTIAIGSNQKQIFSEYNASLSEYNVSRSFIVDKIAMFYSPDDELIADNFITYKVVPLKLGQ